MPLPLLVVVPLAVSGAGGVAALIKGGLDLKKARDSVERSRREQESAVEKFEARRDTLQDCLAKYGTFQFDVQAETLGRFADWLKANERKVRTLDREMIDGVEIVVPSAPDLRVETITVQNFIASGLSAVAAGTAARGTALFGVNALASASTGTAISSLSGAAAQNAALAWLGGGSIATGGGGMAAGVTVLSGVAIGPALLLTGLTVGVKGHKAVSEAEEISATVSKQEARLAQSRAVLDGIEARTDELTVVLSGLSGRARTAIDQLEVIDFDPDLHAERFLEVSLLVRSVRDILNTPVLNATGDLTTHSMEIVERYRSA